MNPYRIEGPAVIHFSGGRSSGYMLHHILDAHGGVLPDDVFVAFENTGKEMEETLRFIRDCGERWSVPIVWLEYVSMDTPSERFRVVDFANASRNGEPFEALIRRKNYLPNPVTRFCTSEMKVNACHRYIRHTLGWDAWTAVVGMRADEPRRLAKLAIPNRDRDERYAPMGVAGVTAQMVGEFWDRQPFDLQLPNNKGKTAHGNCDLCFLKGTPQLVSLIQERPERAIWWARMESEVVQREDNPLMAKFHKDRPSIGEIHRFVTAQGELFEDPALKSRVEAAIETDEALEDCACTD